MSYFKRSLSLLQQMMFYNYHVISKSNTDWWHFFKTWPCYWKKFWSQSISNNRESGINRWKRGNYSVRINIKLLSSLELLQISTSRKNAPSYQHNSYQRNIWRSIKVTKLDNLNIVQISTFFIAKPNCISMHSARIMIKETEMKK